MKTLYIASKVKHAPKWRELRESFKRFNVRIISTWIDEDGPGQTKDRAELAERCIQEAVEADYLILCACPDEVLKGALIEIGARLGAGKEVWFAGFCANWPGGVFAEHPLCREFETICHAIEALAEPVVYKAAKGGGK